MITPEAVPDAARLTGIAPQFLVDDLDMAIAYYRDQLGFGVDFCYDSFYAGVSRDGFGIHLKCAPKALSDRAHRQQNEHLDAYIGVSGVARRDRGPVSTSMLRTPTDTFSASASRPPRIGASARAVRLRRAAASPATAAHTRAAHQAPVSGHAPLALRNPGFPRSFPADLHFRSAAGRTSLSR